MVCKSKQITNKKFCRRWNKFSLRYCKKRSYLYNSVWLWPCAHSSVATGTAYRFKSCCRPFRLKFNCLTLTILTYELSRKLWLMPVTSIDNHLSRRKNREGSIQDLCSSTITAFEWRNWGKSQYVFSVADLETTFHCRSEVRKILSKENYFHWLGFVWSYHRN